MDTFDVTVDLFKKHFLSYFYKKILSGNMYICILRYLKKT